VGLTAHSAHRPKPYATLGESSLAACCGMRATPDYYGKSAPPDRLPSCIGTPHGIGVIRYGRAVSLESRGCGIRTMSSRTPAPSRASFQVVTGLKFPGVHGLHATPVAVASQSARGVAPSNVVASLGLRAHRQPDKPTQRLGTLSCLRLGSPFSSTSALL